MNPCKVRIREAAEVVNTQWPNGNESRNEVGQYSFVIDTFSELEWASNLTLRDIRNTGKPLSLPTGKPSAKRADGDAGKGCWRKQMLHCNDADTDLCLA
ncbi:hypothetical protein [Photobacterium swingsii]|uniref:hypothetical protein n=1 Tax=Photobacterium swingsii TaxID=680026 RepID=UPI004067FE52